MMLYTPDDYTIHDVLRIPPLLVIVSLFLIKYAFILVLIPIFAHFPLISESFKMILPFVTAFAEQYTNLLYLFIIVPAAFVLASMSRRTPKTKSPFLRWCWKNGKKLLFATLIAEIIFTGISLLVGWQQLNEVTLLLIYGNVLCGLYLYKSKHAVDAFAEFPEYDKYAK